MHAQTQTKSKTADDSDSDRDDDDLEDLGESGYSGSTTGGDSGTEVPLYAIPIIRKQETIPEGKVIYIQYVACIIVNFIPSLFVYKSRRTRILHS